MISYTIIKNGNTLTMSLSEDTSMALDSEKDCAVEREIRRDVLTLVSALGKSVIVETCQGIEIKRLSLALGPEVVSKK